MISRMPAGPALVTDVPLDLSCPLADIPVPDGYASAFAIVRLHGTPVGTCRLPVAAGRVSSRHLADAIVVGTADRMLRHLLADRMLSRGLAAVGGDPATLLDTPHAAYSGPWPSVTAAVCTRGRPDDLHRCLAALVRVDYPGLDLLVIDNAPAEASVARAVRDRHPQVRYVSEPRRGLDWARNRAILETSREVLAFTDDDAVVDPGWLRAIVAPLAEDPDVMAVAGLVLPFELETAAQQLFEAHGGLGRGFAPRWVRVPDGEKAMHAVNVTTLGTGANVAYRRTLFEQIGGFDPALDAGTASAAGGDIEMFFRVLKAGHRFVYEPSALVRHCHRRDHLSVRTQLVSWMTGAYAAAVRTAHHSPDERAAIAAFAARLMLLYFPRRLAAAAFGSTLNVGLVLSELRGVFAGRGKYQAALLEAEKTAAAFAGEPLLPAPGHVASRRIPATGRARRGVTVDLDRPLAVIVEGPDDADRVLIEVMHASRRLGLVEIVSRGSPIGRRQLADAIAARFAAALVDVGHLKKALLERLQGRR